MGNAEWAKQEGGEGEYDHANLKETSMDFAQGFPPLIRGHRYIFIVCFPIWSCKKLRGYWMCRVIAGKRKKE